MVVPNKEPANTLLPSVTNIASSSMVHNNMNMDMDVNTSRGRSINSSIDELSAHSSLSSIFYIERMEAQSNNLSWANQVDKFDKYQRLSLFY